VREYRLVDIRSTVSSLLVPKPGGNTKVWSLVETQTLRFGGGLQGQENTSESQDRRCVTVDPPLIPRGGCLLCVIGRRPKADSKFLDRGRPLASSVIDSSRAVRSVSSIVFFSRSSALLSGVRNRDLYMLFIINRESER
jgi:hypothetical protein